jgi:serine/threonine-protein kinase
VTIGDTLGKYRITEKLGEGGMGVVFAGVHEGLGREVAIKLMRAQFVSDEKFLARFQQEAEAVSRIGHANIVAVYDFGRADDGGVFYVMERIRGETLSARLRRSPAPDKYEIVAIFAQICRALQAAHARHIVHRDLKPENVLLQSQANGPPHVKIVDFGVAKVREPLMSAGPNLTAAGALLGTPSYMAPEQITSAQAVDGRADIYSLGAMLYQVLTGSPPFVGDPMAVLVAQMSETAPPPSARAAIQLPTALDAMVLKSLAKRAEERQADPLAFQSELETAWDARPVRKTAPEATPLPRPAARRPAKRAPWMIAGAVAIAGAGVAIAAIGWRKTPDPPPPPVARPASTPSDRAAELVRAALAGDASDRRAALDALGELGARDAVDLVAAALADENPEVRRAAAQTAAVIGRRDDRPLKAALEAAAQRSGGSLAVDVAVARARLGDAAANEDLRRALSMPDANARLKAALALAEQDQLPAAKLRAILATAPSAVRRSIRWRAYLRLYQLGDPEFVRELRAALGGSDPVARLDAAQTLARAGDADGKKALAELAAADGPSRGDADAILAELGDPAARDRVIAELHGSDPAARARAATTLGRVVHLDQDPAALGALARALDDADRSVKLIAASALFSVGGPPAAKGSP